MKGYRRRREIIVIEGHDGVDTEGERRDRVLLKHEFGGHWLTASARAAANPNTIVCIWM